MNHSISTFYYHILTTLIILLFISNLSTTSGWTKSKTTSRSNPIHKTYIRKACNTTRFPILCQTTLYPHASIVKNDRVRLCNVSLLLSLKSTRHVHFTVSKLLKQRKLTRREVPVLKDCVENINDAVYELRKSLHYIKLLGGKDRDFQISNIQTWVSAALTDEYTCLEGFNDQKVRPKLKNRIKKNVVKVSMMTSNSLAFINSLTQSIT